MMTKKQTTLQHIAEKSGFSISTVSRALAGSQRISSATRKKIIQLADACNYQHKCRNVAVITFGFGVYFSNMLQALQSELYNQGFRSFIITPGMLELLEEIPLQGAISLLSENGLEKEWPQKFSCPLICINTHYNWLDKLYSVTTNDAAAVEQAVCSLYNAGHRKIARVTVDFRENNQNAQRRDQRLTELAKKMNFDLVLDSNWGDNPFDTVLMLQRIIDKGVTGIICTSERITPLLAQAVQILRLRVPEDISIACWTTGEHDLSFADWEVYRQDYSGIAAKAVNILNDICNGNPPANPSFRSTTSTGPATALPRRHLNRKINKTLFIYVRRKT